MENRRQAFSAKAGLAVQKQTKPTQTTKQIYHPSLRDLGVLCVSAVYFMVWFTAVRHARRALACLFGLLFSVGLMHGANYGAPQGGSDVRWLEEGKPIERELSVELAK